MRLRLSCPGGNVGLIPGTGSDRTAAELPRSSRVQGAVVLAPDPSFVLYGCSAYAERALRGCRCRAHSVYRCDAGRDWRIAALVWLASPQPTAICSAAPYVDGSSRDAVGCGGRAPLCVRRPFASVPGAISEPDYVRPCPRSALRSCAWATRRPHPGGFRHREVPPLTTSTLTQGRSCPSCSNTMELASRRPHLPPRARVASRACVMRRVDVSRRRPFSPLRVDANPSHWFATCAVGAFCENVLRGIPLSPLLRITSALPLKRALLDACHVTNESPRRICNRNRKPRAQNARNADCRRLNLDAQGALSSRRLPSFRPMLDHLAATAARLPCARLATCTATVITSLGRWHHDRPCVQGGRRTDGPPLLLRLRAADYALSRVVVDLSAEGLEFRALKRSMSARPTVDLLTEFFQGFANHAQVRCTWTPCARQRPHRETVFRPLARALRMAAGTLRGRRRVAVTKGARSGAHDALFALPRYPFLLLTPSLISPSSDYGMGNLRSVAKALAHFAPDATSYHIGPASFSFCGEVVLRPSAMPTASRVSDAACGAAPVLESAATRPSWASAWPAMLSR